MELQNLIFFLSFIQFYCRFLYVQNYHLYGLLINHQNILDLGQAQKCGSVNPLMGLKQKGYNFSLVTKLPDIVLSSSMICIQHVNVVTQKKETFLSRTYILIYVLVLSNHVHHKYYNATRRSLSICNRYSTSITLRSTFIEQ